MAAGTAVARTPIGPVAMRGEYRLRALAEAAPGAPLGASESAEGDEKPLAEAELVRVSDAGMPSGAAGLAQGRQPPGFAAQTAGWGTVRMEFGAAVRVITRTLSAGQISWPYRPIRARGCRFRSESGRDRFAIGRSLDDVGSAGSDGLHPHDGPHVIVTSGSRTEPLRAPRSGRAEIEMAVPTRSVPAE